MSGPYHRPRKWSWFTQRPGYVLFMIREATSVFIGAYLVFLLVLLARLGGGEAGFLSLLDTLQQPWAKLLHGLALIAAVWHTVTWFNATPKAMPVFLGEQRAPDALVAFGMGYAPWIVVSAAILWGVMG